MTKNERKSGRQIRKVARLDRQWRAAGKLEGRIENRLAMELGIAYRSGLGTAARRTQRTNAARPQRAAAAQ